MYRAAVVAILLLTTAFGTLAVSSAETPSSTGDGYSVNNPKFRHYRDHRGGERVLGTPISREFTLMGSKTQLFERGAIQQHADWSMGWLDIVGEVILPYTHFGGLTMPAIDPALVRDAPSPDDPDSRAKALAFVQANAPDEWEGMRTLFYSTFAGTVTYRDAFPLADADQSQVPLVNLEMWGLPISKPAYDPRNHDFVYLRFQRGILHYDKGSDETKWLPVGEYLRALITGQNLPSDLEQEANGSKLYRQYDNSKPLGLGKPDLLPDTDLFAAFEMDGAVVPTPAPPTPPPVPVVAASVTSTPEYVAVYGSEWFVEQTINALNMQAYNPVEFIRQVVEVPDYSRFDIPNRTLYVTERDAFPPALRESRDVQLRWYGGWIAHVIVHAEQHWSGRPTTGLQAEQEARYRQKDFLVNHDCDCNDGAFIKRLTAAINKNNLEFTEWAAP